MRKMIARLTAVLMTLAALAPAAAGAQGMPATAPEPALQAVPQSTQQLQMSFAPLVKKTGPAVVNIYTKRVVKERLRPVSPFLDDPFFSQFFGRNFGGQLGGTRERVESSLGSGVIVDAKGTIATNTHVVKDATEIIAVTTDGREFAATKKLVDEQTDLAILQIDTKGENLPYLSLADSDLLEVGDIVLAIGNPFGVGQTVTSGIISGLARTGVGPTDYGFFIQTDAAINPGNSGGALVDIQGRLVGINSMIFSRSGGSLGIGFAIPANLLKTVVDASRNGSKIVRPWTGFGGQNITSDMVESLGLTRAYGVLVNRVSQKGPAARAGIRVGDIITAAAGHEVRDPQALLFRLTTVPIGTPVKIDLLRDGKPVSVEMTAEVPPEIPPRQETQLTGINPFDGAHVVNISPAVSEELGGLHEDEGVVVIKAESGTSARLGIQEGDIIAAVNGEKITGVTQLRKLLRDARTPRWQVEIIRDGKRITFAVGLQARR